MRRSWTMEQRLKGQNQRAKQVGVRHDLTLGQWLETLEYFDHKCAYCGGEYQVIEHYLPIDKAGTTVSNCVPACSCCNRLKDKKGHNLSFYQNKKIIRFIESKGVKIQFHMHEFKALNVNHVILYCEGCGLRLDVPGLPVEQAEAYISQHFENTGYAYSVE